MLLLRQWRVLLVHIVFFNVTLARWCACGTAVSAKSPWTSDSRSALLLDEDDDNSTPSLPPRRRRRRRKSNIVATIADDSFDEQSPWKIRPSNKNATIRRDRRDFISPLRSASNNHRLGFDFLECLSLCGAIAGRLLRDFSESNSLRLSWLADKESEGICQSSILFLSGTVLSRAASWAPRRWAWIGLLTLASVHQTGRYLQNPEPMRRAVYFWTRAGPIIAHYKFTRRWLEWRGADRPTRDQAYEQLHNRYAGPALDLVLHLRGLYVKMGQVLSSRPDFIPPQYVHAFSELQDNIPAWDAELVHGIALEALRQECPAFEQEYKDIVLDPEALGSASIGQVHRAVLHRKDNTTKEVAVKVMHQGAKSTFEHDFRVFKLLTKIALPSWQTMQDSLETQVMCEFDYLHEADSLRKVRQNMLQSPYRRRVVVPEPIEELCCRHVLVMEMLHGQKLIDSIQNRFAAAIGGNRTAAEEFLKARRHEVLTGDDAGSKLILMRAVKHPMGRLKLLLLFFKIRGTINLLVDTHGYQIFQTGIWNSDPHFGNCMHLHNGRLGLLDYGQCRRIDDNVRRSFSSIVVALDESRVRHLDGAMKFNTSEVAETMRQAGFVLRDDSDDESLLQYARLLFDSDEESQRLGLPTPQDYFNQLMKANPMVEYPESALFVCRTSLMFRGMGHAIGSGQVRTASRWYKHALKALRDK